MERDDEDGPPDEAYSRVTNPERFAVVHDAARAEIARLAEAFRVDRTDGTRLDPVLPPKWDDDPAVRLVPADGGAPITFTFTSFPGVAVRAGHTWTGMFPSCGCDACDEDPATEAERLAELVRDVVAGGLTETRGHRRIGADTWEVRVDDADGGGWSGSSGAYEPDRGDLPVGVTRWPAWVRIANPADA